MFEPFNRLAAVLSQPGNVEILKETLKDLASIDIFIDDSVDPLSEYHSLGVEASGKSYLSLLSYSYGRYTADPYTYIPVCLHTCGDPEYIGIYLMDAAGWILGRIGTTPGMVDRSRIKKVILINNPNAEWNF